MTTLFTVLLGVVILFHIAIAILEIFFFESKFVQQKILPIPSTDPIAKIIAANQGLSNAILAAGLIWSFFADCSTAIQTFFLVSIAIAGIFGSFTLQKLSTFVLQSLPAIVALALLWFVPT